MAQGVSGRQQRTREPSSVNGDFGTRRRASRSLAGAGRLGSWAGDRHIGCGGGRHGCLQLYFIIIFY